jgi:selenocysteine lyase/cysteine desulfurase
VVRVRPAPESPAGHRAELGTQSHEAIAGLVAAVAYLESLGSGLDRRRRLDSAYDRIRGHEEELSRLFLDGLATLPGVTVYGIADPSRVDERTATFAVNVAGRSPRQVAEYLASGGVNVWDGDYYAQELMNHLGLRESGGAVRIGALHYTTPAEIDRALDGLGRLAA